MILKDFPDSDVLAIQEMGDFEDWIENRFGSYVDFLTLKSYEKKEIFLRYKWGFVDKNINENLESTHKYILYMIQGREFKETEDIYWQKAKEWEHYCNEIFQIIGLGQKKEDPLMKMAKQVLR